MNEATKQPEEKMLPADSRAAMQEMLNLTTTLTTLVEEEVNKMALNNTVEMMDVQQRKEKAHARYVAATEEFKARLHEFNNLDARLLADLRAAQKDLGKLAQDNVKRLEKVIATDKQDEVQVTYDD